MPVKNESPKPHDAWKIVAFALTYHPADADTGFHARRRTLAQSHKTSGYLRDRFQP